MLQTLKSTIVLGTLLVVGYGVHVMLNRPPDGTSDPVWNEVDVDLPEIDFGDESLERPSTSLATETPGEPGGPSEDRAISSTDSWQNDHGPNSSETLSPPPFSDPPPSPSAENLAAGELSPDGFSPPLPVAPADTPLRAKISSVSHVASAFDSTWSAAR